MNNLSINEPRTVHFIGICGKGMSAVAVLLKKIGWQVTGSDSGIYDPAKSYLEYHEIPITEGHSPDNIPGDANLIVIGRHAKLTNENPEVAQARSLNTSVVSFPEVLEKLSEKHTSIVVAGSYGKSTLTMLVTWCLQEAGHDPSYFIGAGSSQFRENAYLGDGDYFVLEGDEYPSSMFDETSKFLYYHPHHLLLTSCEHDHVNVFPTEQEYIEPYQKLIQSVPNNGSITGAVEHPHVAELLDEAQYSTYTYGVEYGDWQAKNISYGATTTFELWNGDTYQTTLSTTLLGRHNIENIVGASALLLGNNILTLDEVTRGVDTFTAPTRRLDLKNPEGSVPIYEGYGTSYTKAKTAIDAMRLHFSNKKLITIFEPHTFSWQSKEKIDWYDDVFFGVDELCLVPPPASHGKDTDNQLSIDEIVKRIQENTDLTPTTATTQAEALSFVQDTLTDNSVILLLSSGDLLGLPNTLSGWLEDKSLT